MGINGFGTTTEVSEYINCSLCGAKVEIDYNYVSGYYKGECPFCHKWCEGRK